MVQIMWHLPLLVHVLWPYLGDARPDRQILLHQLAVNEARAAGLIPSGPLSQFGEQAMKFPASWVYNVTSLTCSRSYRINFQGGRDDIRNRRRWIHAFIRENFDDRDYLLFTDAKEAYVPRGKFDHSLARQGFIPRIYKGKGMKFMKATFDVEFYAMMVASNFTLCPGGDKSWSMRMGEAALTKSIPIINRLTTDYTDPQDDDSWFFQIPYEFVLVRDYIHTDFRYDPAIAQRNFDTFFKYQTFLLGDNVPP
jgi:hypothetical protein